MFSLFLIFSLSSTFIWIIFFLLTLDLVYSSFCSCLKWQFLLFSLLAVSNSATSWTATHQASLSFTISWSLLKLLSIESVMPSNHLTLCHSLLLLPSIFPSNRVFSSESALLIRWPKYWSFSFSISLSNEYSGLTSFWMDWFVSPCSPRDSQESSPTPQFKSINFFGAQPSLWPNSHIHIWLPEKP